MTGPHSGTVAGGEDPDATLHAQQHRVDRQLKGSVIGAVVEQWEARHEEWLRFGELPPWRQVFRSPPGRPPREFARFLYDALSQEW